MNPRPGHDEKLLSGGGSKQLVPLITYKASEANTTSQQPTRTLTIINKPRHKSAPVAIHSLLVEGGGCPFDVNRRWTGPSASICCHLNGPAIHQRRRRAAHTAVAIEMFIYHLHISSPLARHTVGGLIDIHVQAVQQISPPRPPPALTFSKYLDGKY